MKNRLKVTCEVITQIIDISCFSLKEFTYKNKIKSIRKIERKITFEYIIKHHLK